MRTEPRRFRERIRRGVMRRKPQRRKSVMESAASMVREAFSDLNIPESVGSGRRKDRIVFTFFHSFLLCLF